MQHGVVTRGGAIDREIDANLNITVRATSADGSHADKVHDRVNDVDEFDVTTRPTRTPRPTPSTRTRPWDVVGVTAFASDADATTNTVTYSLTDSAGGKFAIDATTAWSAWRRDRPRASMPASTSRYAPPARRFDRRQGVHDRRQ
jgi:hypothetical protein